MKSNTEILQDAETIAREFKEFAYIMAHDFSSPIRAIVEFSKLLKTEHEAALNDEGHQYLSFIVDSGERMQNMLDSIMEFSRISTMAKPRAKVNLNLIVEECKLLLADKIKTAKAVLEIENLPTVQADADHMLLLFLGIIDNAIKYRNAEMPPHIKISVKKENGELIFTISDNGIGMEEKNSDRIFQPFRKLHHEEDYPGLGMGLAIVKKIVVRHDGKIWVESEPGIGTRFIFSIPE